MLMNPEHLPKVFAEFLDSTVIPKANSLQKFGAYSILFVLNNKMSNILTQYSPIMKMTGIMNDTGMIDLEYTHEMINSSVSKVGTVNILGYNVDSSDIDVIYNLARKYI